jgi:hypothetical protein
MRFTLLSLALVVAVLAFATVPDARAQAVYVSPGYSGYYYPTYNYGNYYNPGIYYAPSGYVPPYYWSNSYYYGRRGGGWYSGAYSPYTNQYQYYYGYRYYPRYRR